MKILVISDAWHPQINGVVRTYEYLGEALQNMGHDLHVIGPADFPFTISMPGYAEIKLALMPYNKLKTYIEDYQADHIHIATEGPLGWAGRKYCIKNSVEFSTSYHTQFPDYLAKRISKFLPFLYNPVYRLAKNFVRKFHAPADILYTATPSLEKQLRDWNFAPPLKRLTRGAVLDLFYPGEQSHFKDLPSPIALYVGRVAIEKNIEDFLSMEWEGSKVVVGDGPSLQELKKQYPETLFTGKQEGKDLAALYRSADIFVFPSKTDTFGIVLIEALASGLPVAAYNVMGPCDIINESFLGALNDNLSLAAKQALNAPKTKEDRAQHVKEYYTWENAAKQFIEAMS